MAGVALAGVLLVRLSAVLQAQTEEAALVVTTDLPAVIMIDLTEVATLVADGQTELRVPLGEHLIRAVSTENGTDMFQQVISVENTRSKALMVELRPVAMRRITSALAGTWTGQARRMGTWANTNITYTLDAKTSLTLTPDDDSLTGRLYMERTFTDRDGEQLQEVTATLHLLVDDQGVRDVLVEVGMEKADEWSDLPTLRITDWSADGASGIQFTLFLRDQDEERVELRKVLSP